ncbi:putative short-chain dehydrogenase/reductase family protein [Paramyrothecium foliicola]|nr:putative short-chain dehydrogenase/reductase family protein [Paramyrothecium foliicola]
MKTGYADARALLRLLISAYLLRFTPVNISIPWHLELFSLPKMSNRRKSHKKSREGCMQCKERHVKVCDEDTLPVHLATPSGCIETNEPSGVLLMRMSLSCSFSSMSVTRMPLDSDSIADLELLDYSHRNPVITAFSASGMQDERDHIRLGFSHHYLLNSVLAVAALQLYNEDRTRTQCGKTAIITGSNGGLGFEASRQLLQLGLQHLIMAVRSQGRGDEAAEKLRAQFPSASIDVFLLDMADYSSILAFTRRCRDLQHIDYAVLNAGLQNGSFIRNENTGHEAVFQVNYLSTALLASTLAMVMKEKCRTGSNDPPVLSVVGSDTMWFSRLKIVSPISDIMDNPVRFERIKTYGDSKLLIMLFMYQLAKKFNPNDILINVCNPGLVGSTNLSSHGEQPGIIKKMMLDVFLSVFSRSLETGASNYVYALFAGRRSHGSFVSDWDIKPYPRILYNESDQRAVIKLWDETIEEFGSASVHGFDLKSMTWQETAVA